MAGDGARGATLPAGSIPAGPPVAIAPGTRVITDLHLFPGGDARTDAFVAECDGLAGVPRLIVLGDLFDVWVGAKQARVAGTARVLEALRRLVERGVAVDVVPGNRDALLDGAFVRATGAALHPEGFVGEAPGGLRVVFVHGDSLCTLDRDYQRLRRVWRIGVVRRASRFLPLWWARRVGARLRRASEAQKPLKLEAVKAIQPAAVEALARATGAELVVCGHAHVPRDERVSAARWIVVGAWRENERDVLTFGADGAVALCASDSARG